MAKARFALGLRRGSTKSTTYSTLATRKEGRIQIIKDRVYDVTNPQTTPQMIQRVCFATANSAAAKMSDLISISTEGITKPSFAKQAFIERNVNFLKSVAGRRVGTNLHYLAAFAPKDNQQLIPNSYIVSKGSLTLPEVLKPKVPNNAGSFGDIEWSAPGVLNNPLTIGQSYTPAQLWSLLFGLQPGDQLTIPQIYGDGIAQALYSGTESETVVDKTLNTSFCAPRLVLLSEMPTATTEITGVITSATIQAALRSGIDTDASYGTLVDNFIAAVEVDEAQDSSLFLSLTNTYDEIYAIDNDGELRALGCILSRRDESGTWRYSTSQLMCVWDFIGQNSGADYFGFTLQNAIDTYLNNVQKDTEGNFLQRGGDPDIVPSSFA